MARYTVPLSERPSAQALDYNLSKRSSEIFKERQKWLSTRDEVAYDAEIDEKSTKNFMILIGIMIIVLLFGHFFRYKDEKHFEKILKENKEKKSK